MRRLIACLILTASLLTAGPALSEPSTVAPTYPFTPSEARVVWAQNHPGRLTRPQAQAVARYLNAATLALIADYVRAVQIAYAQAVHAATTHADLVYRWQGVANCESGGNWHISTGNGYYGGVQFLLSTWQSVGGSGYPHQNSPAEQAYRAEILKNRSGLGQWPHCGRYYR